MWLSSLKYAYFGSIDFKPWLSIDKDHKGMIENVYYKA